MLVQPNVSFGHGYHGGLAVRSGGGKVSEDVRLPEQRLSPVGQFHGEQPFMDDLPQAIDHAGAVEVETRRNVVIQGMEAGALGEGVLG